MRERPHETLSAAVWSCALLWLVTSATVWPRPARVRPDFPITSDAYTAAVARAPESSVAVRGGFDHVGHQTRQNPAIRSEPVTGSATPALYGEAPDGAGYDYIVVDVDGVQVIAPLNRLFSAGTFANNDSSHEYAIETSTGTLYTIDTTNGTTTAIGGTGGLSGAQVSMRWDPTDGSTLAVKPLSGCADSALYSIDLATGAATLIGPLTGTCVQSMAIDSTGTIYLLDRTTSTLERIDDNTGTIETIGPLGFDVDDTSSMDFDRSSDSLYMFSAPNGVNNLYSVDTVLGQATLIGPLGVDVPVTAVAAGIRPLDAIFADGFESP